MNEGAAGRDVGWPPIAPAATARARRAVGRRTLFAPALALAAAALLALPAPAAADLPAGDTALTYQLRTTHTDDPSLSPSTVTEQDLGVFVVQELPNYGFLRAEAHLFDPTGGGLERGWTQAALTDLRFDGLAASVALGDLAVDATLLPRRLLILTDPAFEVEGAQLALATGSTRVGLFGGRAVDRGGSFATALTRLPQDVVGGSVRHRLGARVALSALYLHTSGEGTAGRAAASTDSVGLGADLRLLGPLALVGEVRYTADPNGAGAPGRSDGLSYAVGPVVERPGLRVEATAFSLDPSYMPVLGANQSADRRGVYAGFTWDPDRLFGLFGSTLHSRNNLADDPTVATIDTTQVVAGARAYLPVRWPVTAIARADRTTLDSRSAPAPPGVESTTTSLFAEVAQVIGAWRPLLRGRWVDFDDDAVGESSTTLDLTAELAWQVTRRSRLWALLEWVDVSATPGLSDSSLYLARLGGEQRVSAALFVRAEGELALADELDTSATRAGLSASVGYHHHLFDAYLDLRHNWTDTSGGAPTRAEDAAYLRVTVPLRWGRTTPPPVGRAPGVQAGGWGTVEGEVFVDEDGDGARDPGERGLEGLRLVLDGLPGVTATTDRDGRYRFTGVATGPHSVRVEVRRLPADFDLVSPQLVEVTVERRGTARADFVVQPLGRVEGRLRRLIVREGGEAVPSGEVGSIPLFLRRGEQIWQTYSDGDGRYTFENVRGGEYEVFVDPGALPPGATVEPTTRRVVLPVGETRGEVDLTIREPARPEIRNGGGTPGHPAGPVPPPDPASKRPADRSRDCFGDSPEPGMIGFFRFPFDSDELVETADQAAEFQQWARWLAADPGRQVVLEGHTDPVGDDPYNFGLAGRRATAVFERLVAAGAPRDRMRMVAEGPDLPCDPGDGEHAWARNRRTLILVEVE